MSQFILLIRGGEDLSANLSPEQIQEAIERYSAWARKLGAQGKLVSTESYRQALNLAGNEVERRFLEKKLKLTSRSIQVRS